jgi:hypothetical protein
MSKLARRDPSLIEIQIEIEIEIEIERSIFRPWMTVRIKR